MSLILIYSTTGHLSVIHNNSINPSWRIGSNIRHISRMLTYTLYHFGSFISGEGTSWFELVELPTVIQSTAPPTVAAPKPT